MTKKLKIAVTGAFGYSGKYITRNLLSQGHEVITLTNNPNRSVSFDKNIQAFPFNFDQPKKLEETLKGSSVLINTYWVRFNHGKNTYQQAISNTRKLLQAAKVAGIKKIVHVSISNPSTKSNLTYFWGKAILEEDIKASGISYTILRPTVIFGKEDILINNIAWFLRHIPIFGLPGNGEYKLQPIYVEDLAALVASSINNQENHTIDAIGPETYTFKSLVETIRKTIKSRTLILPFPPLLAYLATRFAGYFLGDTILTKDEIVGLMDNLLVTNSPPAGKTKLSEWLEDNKDTLGKRYANEIKRHFSPSRA